MSVTVVNAGPEGRFNRGSFFFRADRWREDEMESILFDVGRRSIHYYLAKHGEDAFVRSVI